ncbi:ferrous iron transport protein B [Leptospira borgpetersenii]|uniref:ferrous iron transport protein B n=1 Tax=Leptospira borgpetersenii TaxID=174 RepID=UPI00187F3823|nr:ferrous iron transport protein B [Leptospira borgpetersenii]MBE8363590.1 ferrous iron transport protein B [Leptospira borgpetersenii serovar Balcanica]MBE8367319.1 ferrous iron transport protein B [Leptospira borgpetersenii serovar Balcanica]MBE8423196.1 ferrous iron transport protein B [Leptospira borgpetersenii serovar Balcanica]MBF3350281.1 ferrous iron transport protein B [Leptospira borgpetersenii serovar Balcanica]
MDHSKTVLSSKTSRILMAGNPNCGKSTLFNRLTGLRQKTGNYHGVTVEKAEGLLSRHGEQPLKVLDLPGAFSLGGNSEDKQITSKVLISHREGDKILFVMDASLAERSLQFLLQVLELNIPVLVAVTMKDVLEKKRIRLELDSLSREFGILFQYVNPKNGDGVQELKNLIFSPDSFRLPIRSFSWDPEREKFLNGLLKSFSSEYSDSLKFVLINSFKELSGEVLQKGLPGISLFPENSRKFIREEFNRFGKRFTYLEELTQKSIYIKKILGNAIVGNPIPGARILSKADKILLHPFWGVISFLGIMALVFQTLFTWSEIPMNWIELMVQSVGSFVGRFLDEGPLRSLIQEGIIGGVGAVLVFIPQIGLLFLFIGILEETGYIARASFVMDRFMGKFGLSGKSFIPLLSSAACAVPAIMGTRTIENKSDRITTILVAPLITCSARYPVYILVISAIFPAGNFWGFFNIQALTMFGLFLLGMISSMLAALVFKKTFFKSDSSYFLMELPAYNTPSIKSLALTVFKKLKAFLSTAGQIILFISILLWFLANYPRIDSSVYPNADGVELKKIQIRESYAGSAGKLMEPVLKPIGFDWKMGIGIITSFAAREIMVSTLSIIYGVGGESDDDLKEAIRKDKDEDGKAVWGLKNSVSLLLFFAFACQCMSTIAVVKKETNSVFWPSFLFTYMTILAYSVSFSVFQIWSLFS